MSIILKLIGLWVVIFIVLIISIVCLRVLLPDYMSVRAFVGALIFILGIRITIKVKKDGGFNF
jgi:hypothetical protein